MSLWDYLNHLFLVVAALELSIWAVVGGEQQVSEQALPRAKRRERHQYPQLIETNVINAVSGLPMLNA